jgi:hypothetical protein
MKYSMKNELKTMLLIFGLAFVSSCYYEETYGCQ